MSGNIWMYSYDIDEQDIDMLQRDFITFKQGAEYYKMGMKPFIRNVESQVQFIRLAKW